MTSPADELRAAATRLKKLASQATPGPWEATWRGQEYQLDGNSEDDLSPVAEWTYAIVATEPAAAEQRAECDTADADYIAAMGPNVALALADWLDETAAHLAATATPFWQEGVGRHPLAVARGINGGQP